MSETIKELLTSNEEWADGIKKDNPNFFKDLAKGQSPEFLWIGCADSRVPPNQLSQSMPGTIFVQRNIANMVIHTDTNLQSVVNYAVKFLKVKHIIVCGHYGCGGVQAAMSNKSFGILDPWLLNIKDVYRIHQEKLDKISDEGKRFDEFVRLNVLEQVKNLGKISFIQEEWEKGESPHIHGLVYNLKEGLLEDLEISYNSNEGLDKIYRYQDNPS